MNFGVKKRTSTCLACNSLLARGSVSHRWNDDIEL